MPYSITICNICYRQQTVQHSHRLCFEQVVVLVLLKILHTDAQLIKENIRDAADCIYIYILNE